MDKHQIERRLSLEQLVQIAEGHLEREESFLYQANQYLFTDTNAITTFMFSQYYHQTALPKLVNLQIQRHRVMTLFFFAILTFLMTIRGIVRETSARKIFHKTNNRRFIVWKISFFVLKVTLKPELARLKRF